MQKNPFTSDPERFEIWEMLVARDIDAYAKADWRIIADDFVEEGFMGIDGRRLGNPDFWRLSFPTLEAYREEWLRQAYVDRKQAWGEDLAEALHRVTTLKDIEIHGESALVHKKFDGNLLKADGKQVRINWQTLYRCRKIGDRWKIAGFTGYLPYPLGLSSTPEKQPIDRPRKTSQHITAGPYSPVLVVHPHQVVVISGQAAIDPNGKVIGKTIEEQARYTLDNCRRQLESAGAKMNDVFKVNVYLTDLADWPRFNRVYEQYFDPPLPVRTAIGAALLDGLIVEVEMWAAKMP